MSFLTSSSTNTSGMRSIVGLTCMIALLLPCIQRVLHPILPSRFNDHGEGVRDVVSGRIQYLRLHHQHARFQNAPCGSATVTSPVLFRRRVIRHTTHVLVLHLLVRKDLFVVAVVPVIRHRLYRSSSARVVHHRDLIRFHHEFVGQRTLVFRIITLSTSRLRRAGPSNLLP